MGVWNKIQPQYLGYADGADALVKGLVDALWLFTGFPNAAVISAAEQKEIKLIPLYKEAMKTVINTWGLHYAKFIMNHMDRSDQNFLWEPATNFMQASSDPEYYGKKISMLFVRYLHSYSLVPNADLEKLLEKLKA